MDITSTKRLGAAAAIAGVVLTLTCFVVVTVGVTDPFAPISSADYMTRIDRSPTLWLAVHLTISLALLAKLAGLLSIADTIDAGRNHPFVRTGNVFAVLGSALFLVTMVFDGYVHGYIAHRWHDASPGSRSGWEDIFGASLRTSYGMELVSLIALVGFAPIAYGVAMSTTAAFPRWLARLGVYGGIGAIVTAVVLWIGGPSDLGYGALYPLFAILAPTVWLLSAASTVWRSAAEPSASAAAPPAKSPVPHRALV